MDFPNDVIIDKLPGVMSDNSTEEVDLDPVVTTHLSNLSQHGQNTICWKGG